MNPPKPKSLLVICILLLIGAGLKLLSNIGILIAYFTSNTFAEMMNGQIDEQRLFVMFAIGILSAAITGTAATAMLRRKFWGLLLYTIAVPVFISLSLLMIFMWQMVEVEELKELVRGAVVFLIFCGFLYQPKVRSYLRKEESKITSNQ